MTPYAMGHNYEAAGSAQIGERDVASCEDFLQAILSSLIQQSKNIEDTPTT
jgi:hypothetical protein